MDLSHCCRARHTRLLLFPFEIHIVDSLLMSFLHPKLECPECSQILRRERHIHEKKPSNVKCQNCISFCAKTLEKSQVVEHDRVVGTALLLSLCMETGEIDFSHVLYGGVGNPKFETACPRDLAGF